MEKYQDVKNTVHVHAKENCCRQPLKTQICYHNTHTHTLIPPLCASPAMYSTSPLLLFQSTLLLSPLGARWNNLRIKSTSSMKVKLEVCYDHWIVTQTVPEKWVVLSLPEPLSCSFTDPLCHSVTLSLSTRLSLHHPLCLHSYPHTHHVCLCSFKHGRHFFFFIPVFVWLCSSRWKSLKSWSCSSCWFSFLQRVAKSLKANSRVFSLVLDFCQVKTCSQW